MISRARPCCLPAALVAHTPRMLRLEVLPIPTALLEVLFLPLPSPSPERAVIQLNPSVPLPAVPFTCYRVQPLWIGVIPLLVLLAPSVLPHRHVQLPSLYPLLLHLSPSCILQKKNHPSVFHTLPLVPWCRILSFAPKNVTPPPEAAVVRTAPLKGSDGRFSGLHRDQPQDRGWVLRPLPLLALPRAYSHGCCIELETMRPVGQG